jgi:hypothetical protein
VELVVVPPAIGCAGDVPVRAVVGDDQPVGLHRAGDAAGLPRQPGDVDARLQPQPLAHPRQRRVLVVGGEVARGPHVLAPGARHRHAQRVVDPAGTGEQRQDRQPGGVGRRPARGAHARPPQAPGRARAGHPAPALAPQREQLVEPAAMAVDQQRVAIAAALDPNAARDRVAHAVALRRVVEPHPRALRAPPDDGVGDPDRPALPAAGAEVGVHAVVEPDRADDRVRVAGDRQIVHPLVGRERGREQGAAGKSRRGEGDAQHVSARSRPRR